jgi:hypothetical protein
VFRVRNNLVICDVLLLKFAKKWKSQSLEFVACATPALLAETSPTEMSIAAIPVSVPRRLRRHGAWMCASRRVFLFADRASPAAASVPMSFLSLAG